MMMERGRISARGASPYFKSRVTTKQPDMTLTKEQKEVGDQLKFAMEMHMNMDKSGHLQHGCTYKGMKITQVVTTPKKNGVWGKGVTRWYIDQEKTEYKTPIALIDELIKRTPKKAE